jgi:hypothetical protein
MGLHNKVRKDIDDKLGNTLSNNSFDDEVEVNLQIPIDKPN